MIWEDLQCPLGGEIERRGWLSVPRLCGVDRVDNVSVVDIVRGNRWVVQWIFAIAADHFSSRSVQWTFALHFLSGFNSLNCIELTIDRKSPSINQTLIVKEQRQCWQSIHHTYIYFFSLFSCILQSLDLGREGSSGNNNDTMMSHYHRPAQEYQYDPSPPPSSLLPHPCPRDLTYDCPVPFLTKVLFCTFCCNCGVGRGCCAVADTGNMWPWKMSFIQDIYLTWPDKQGYCFYDIIIIWICFQIKIIDDSYIIYFS